MRKRNLVNQSSDEVEWLTLKLANGGEISNLSFTADQINDPILKKLKQSQHKMLNDEGDVLLKLVNVDTSESYNVSMKKLRGEDTYLFHISDKIKLQPQQEIKLRYDNHVIYFHIV